MAKEGASKRKKSIVGILLLVLTVLLTGWLGFLGVQPYLRKHEYVKEALQRSQKLTYNIEEEKFITVEPSMPEEAHPGPSAGSEHASPPEEEASEHHEEAVSEDVKVEEPPLEVQKHAAAGPGETPPPTEVPVEKYVPKPVEEAAVPSEEAKPEENKPEEEATPALPAGPKITIIITGLGISRSTSNLSQELPKEVGFSISPYSHFGEELAKSSVQKGRQVFVDLPMEPTDFPAVDAGPYALMGSKELVENLSRLEWLLARVPGAYGVISPYDEKYTDAPQASQVLAKINELKLPMIYARRTPSEEFARQAVKMRAVVVVPDAVVDEKADGQSIMAKLGELEKIAIERGHALGLGRPYPITVKTVSNWAKELEDKNIALTPLILNSGKGLEVTPEDKPDAKAEVKPEAGKEANKDMEKKNAAAH